MHDALPSGFTYHGVTYTGDQAAIAQGDNFLSMIIPKIMASQAYQHNGVIVIWFDETEGEDPVDNSYSTTIPEIIISPLAKGNAYDSTLNYTHSSDLKTWQEVFGVSAPGGGFLGDANTPGTNDLSDMFEPYPLRGQIETLPGPLGTGQQLEEEWQELQQEWQANLQTLLQGPLGTLLALEADFIDSESAKWAGQTPPDSGVYAIGTTLYVIGANTSDYALISPLGSKLDGSTGLDVAATLNNACTHVSFTQTFTAIDVFGYGGNDNIQLSPTLTLPTTVVEGNGNNYIALANGNDTVTLGTGSNQVFGGNGNKTITATDAGGSSSYIQLGLGNETISLGAGNDQVVLGGGTNTVTAGNGNDAVTSGNGTNTITLGNGNDYLHTGNGTDVDHPRYGQRERPARRRRQDRHRRGWQQLRLTPVPGPIRS